MSDQAIKLPTEEEAFGLPSEAEAFPVKRPEEPSLFGFVRDRAVAYVGNKFSLDQYSYEHRMAMHEYFKTGFKQGFGDQPYFMDRPLYENDPQSTPRKYLERAGVIGDLEDKNRYFDNIFEDALFLKLPDGIDSAFRAVMGLVYGESARLKAQGLPSDLTPSAYMEAFPAGHMTGMPSILRPGPKALINLDDAARLGILGDAPSAAELARRAFDPNQRVHPAGEAIPPTETTPGVETTAPTVEMVGKEPIITNPREDIHLAARAVEPELFRQWDGLTEQKRALDSELDEMRPAIGFLGEASDSTEMRIAKGYRDRVAKEMIELAPRVQEAYREANRLMPANEADAAHLAEIVDPAVENARADAINTYDLDTLPPVAPGMVRFYHGGVIEPKAGEPRWVAQQPEYAANYRPGAKLYYVDIAEDSPLLNESFDRTGTNLKASYVNFDAPPEIAQGLRPVPERARTAEAETVPIDPNRPRFVTEPDDVAPDRFVAKDGEAVAGKGDSREAAVADAEARDWKPYPTEEAAPTDAAASVRQDIENLTQQRDRAVANRDAATDPAERTAYDRLIQNQEARLQDLEKRLRQTETATPTAAAGPVFEPLKGGTIASDQTARLRAVGVPAPIARVSAALVEAYYRTRAARYKGAKGTAEELYQGTSPLVVRAEEANAIFKPGELGQTARTRLFRDLFMKAHNAITKSPEFKEWFGSSKVVDGKGRPQIVYHGTTTDFKSFDPGRQGQATGTPAKGFFFASDPEVAGSYIADVFGHDGVDPYIAEPLSFREDARIVPAYLQLENPLIIDYAGKSYKEQPFQTVLEDARAKGHDGVIIKNTYDPGFHKSGEKLTDIYAAFYPEQIKSPFNRGDFSPRSYDILEQMARGKIQLADPEKNMRAIITLFDKADASTFLHELAHHWLHDLMRDATDPQAPLDLIADARTIREWLKAKEGAPLTRAQHEKFARGIERFYMEGQAPTAELVGTFEKLKIWMTDIYRTVGRLRAPINDQVRGVFDRLLNEPNREPVIAPEREGGLTFAEEAKAAAKDTPVGKETAKADEIAQTRHEAGTRLSGDLDVRRRDARGGPEGISVPRTGEGEVGAKPGGSGLAATDERLSEGRTPAKGTSEVPARSSDTFEQSTATPFTDKAGNIRLENLNVEDDVAEAIRQAAAQRGGFMEARRGSLSDVEVQELADDLGMSPAHIDSWKVGQAFNAEQILSARQALIQSATDVRDKAAAVASGGGTAEILDYAEARQRNVMIQRVVTGMTAEAGRALRAFRDLALIKDDVLFSEMFQKTLDMTPEALKQEAIQVNSLKNSAQVNKRVRKAYEPTWKDMVQEGYINSLLSGLFTQIVNITGNLSVAVTSPVTAVSAATRSALLDPIRGRERAVTYHEALDRVYGIYSGAIRGASIFGEIILDENKGLGVVSSTELRKFQAIPSINVAGFTIPAGQIVRFPGRMLMAADQFFKAIAFDQELAVLARRAAREEGLSGDALDARIAEHMANPSDGMAAIANQHAAYQTFTNDLGQAGRFAQAFANSHLAVKMLVPFIRTPANLFKYSVEHTPLGFATRRMRDDLSGRNGPAAVHEAWGKMATGTVVGTAFAGLTLAGFVTGSAPKDPGEKETFRKAGFQEYSIKIGSTWHSYRRFDPLGTIIGLVADMTLTAKYALTTEDEHSKLGTMVMMAINNNVFDKLSMRGVTNLVQAVVDPDRYGQSFVNSTVGSMIPFGGAVSQFARMEDPLMRDTRSFADSLLARVPSKISVPFTDVSLPLPWSGRESLFVRRDRWGEPIPETELGPIATMRSAPDFIDTVMQRLQINKDQPQRKIQNVELTQQQYDDYVRLEGRMAKQMLDAIITPDLVGRMPPGITTMLINKLIDKSRTIAQKQVMFGSLGGQDDIVAKAMQLKLNRLKPAPAP